MLAPLETKEQQVFVAKLLREGHFVFAIPNWKEMRKCEGALPGMPDLGIAFDGARILWIEMKRRKDGTISPDQKTVHKMFRAMGHTVLVPKGAKEAYAMFTKFIDEVEV